MSSTRTAAPGTPLAQSRWMSAPELVALGPINGVTLSARAKRISDSNLRRLLYWIQGRSLEEGGLQRIAEGLLDQFPENIVIRESTVDIMDPLPGEPDSYVWRDDPAEVRLKLLSEIPELLVRLCLDPGISLPDGMFTDDHGDRTSILPKAFRNLVPSLLGLINRDSERAVRAYHLTAVGQQIWEQLDFCMELKKPVVICGDEGIGKTSALNAWLAAHEGQARKITLTATNNLTEFFRALSRALGVASSYVRKVDEMKARCVDVLVRSGLLLAIDEAHQILPRGKRVETTPVLLEWLYAALKDPGVPVALVCTPQFKIRAAHIASRTGWNADQVFRREKHFQMLPKRLDPEDLASVARSIAPEASPEVRAVLVTFANMRKHQIDALEDVLCEAKLLARSKGRTVVSADDLVAAMAIVDANLSAKILNPTKPRAGRRIGSAPVTEADAAACDPVGRDSFGVRETSGSPQPVGGRPPGRIGAPAGALQLACAASASGTRQHDFQGTGTAAEA